MTTDDAYATLTRTVGRIVSVGKLVLTVLVLALAFGWVMPKLGLSWPLPAIKGDQIGVAAMLAAIAYAIK